MVLIVVRLATRHKRSIALSWSGSKTRLEVTIQRNTACSINLKSLLHDQYLFWDVLFVYLLLFVCLFLACLSPVSKFLFQYQFSVIKKHTR